MFNLSPIYYARKSSNHKLSITTKSVLTKIYIKQNINKHQTQNFQRISPFGITPVKKKAHKARHAGIVDHSVNLSIQDFKKYKKGMDRSNKKLKNII